MALKYAHLDVIVIHKVLSIVLSQAQRQLQSVYAILFSLVRIAHSVKRVLTEMRRVSVNLQAYVYKMEEMRTAMAMVCVCRLAIKQSVNVMMDLKMMV